MDDYYDFDPDLNIDYGKSPQGNEVLIIDSREIFRLKKLVKELYMVIVHYHGVVIILLVVMQL
jgi:hypothetical protein